MSETLAEHGVDSDSLPLFMSELAREDELLVSASLYATENKALDVHGFDEQTGKASFVLTLNLENGCVLETRENICFWERLDKCLSREVKDALRIYRQMERKGMVQPGAHILNL
ncbi:MAG: hypothetical protein AB7E32_07865 [Desulfovibrio sp.]